MSALRYRFPLPRSEGMREVLLDIVEILKAHDEPFTAEELKGRDAVGRYHCGVAISRALALGVRSGVLVAERGDDRRRRQQAKRQRG